jgi:HSP20 family protein
MNTNKNLLVSPFTDFMKKFFGDDDANYVTTLFEGRGNCGLINVYEKENEYTIELSAPGLKKEDIKIELEENVLKISSTVEDKKEDNFDGYYRKEFRKSSFERSFQLPKDVAKNKISASMVDGILTLTAPKFKEEKKESTTITIK